MASSLDQFHGSRIEQTDAGDWKGSCVQQISRSQTIEPSLGQCLSRYCRGVIPAGRVNQAQYSECG